ncbi:MAG: hypothetical protein K2F73_01575, partial [Ruminococcus sp.]|nr:hypothetical protein [Ruminococcus sp.]
MKKVIIAMVVLLVVAGGSIGAFLSVKKKSDEETRKQQIQEADNILFNFDSESITEISFDFPDGIYTIRNDENTWKLDSDEFTVDTT